MRPLASGMTELLGPVGRGITFKLAGADDAPAGIGWAGGPAIFMESNCRYCSSDGIAHIVKEHLSIITPNCNM